MVEQEIEKIIKIVKKICIYEKIFVILQAKTQNSYSNHIQEN